MDRRHVYVLPRRSHELFINWAKIINLMIRNDIASTQRILHDLSFAYNFRFFPSSPDLSISGSIRRVVLMRFEDLLNH